MTNSNWTERQVECEDGVTRTFTRRGRHEDNGFVRVNGRTVIGWMEDGKFYAYRSYSNGHLITAARDTASV